MSTRKEILEMLSSGQISVSQATDLLNAVNDAPVEPAPPAPPAPPPTPVAPQQPRANGDSGPRWLHVHVSDLESGKSRVRVNVPLGLVNFGLKVGARFTNELDDGLVRDVMDVLQDTKLTGTLVEVEDIEDNERVHIYVD